MADACQHRRKRLIARDEVLQFEECLDCGEILEQAAPDPAANGESLSDA
jgi:hypothetical protein